MDSEKYFPPQEKSSYEAIRNAHEKYVADGGKPMPNFDDMQPNDRLDHCEYYLIAGSIPIAFLVDHEGRRYGARRPGDKPGTLIPDATLLSRFSKDDIDFSPIGEEEFKQRVRDYVRRPPVVDSKGR